MKKFMLPVCLMVLLVAGCAPKMSFFGGGPSPLAEYVLEGESSEKIVVVPVRGVISDDPEEGLFNARPGMLQETVARLRKAAEDEDVKALVLMIDSPGGGGTESDVLYHEVKRFKEETQKPVIAAMLNVAASGGYYIAAAADWITAHPHTITGSIGTIMMRPKVVGLMDKIGVEAKVVKSGLHKDMGSPFRDTSEMEEDMFQEIIDTMNARFLQVVQTERSLDKNIVDTVSDARILTAYQALELNLIDEVGYPEDALDKAREKAELPDDAKVVVYRRAPMPDETVYNFSSTEYAGSRPSLIESGLARYLAVPRTGFYYLWAPEYE